MGPPLLVHLPRVPLRLGVPLPPRLLSLRRLDLLHPRAVLLQPGPLLLARDLILRLSLAVKRPALDMVRPDPHRPSQALIRHLLRLGNRVSLKALDAPDIARGSLARGELREERGAKRGHLVLDVLGRERPVVLERELQLEAFHFDRSLALVVQD